MYTNIYPINQLKRFRSRTSSKERGRSRSRSSERRRSRTRSKSRESTPVPGEDEGRRSRTRSRSRSRSCERRGRRRNDSERSRGGGRDLSPTGSGSPDGGALPSFLTRRSPTPPGGQLGGSNKGHQMMQKMGWKGAGLGSQVSYPRFCFSLCSCTFAGVWYNRAYKWWGGAR